MPPRLNTILALIFCQFLAIYSYAQANNTDLNQAKSLSPSLKKEVLNFEDELIEGSAQKPELFYMFQKKNINYNRLIKLRENFLPEMRKAAEDIRRLKGGN